MTGYSMLWQTSGIARRKHDTALSIPLLSSSPPPCALIISLSARVWSWSFGRARRTMCFLIVQVVRPPHGQVAVQVGQVDCSHRALSESY